MQLRALNTGLEEALKESQQRIKSRTSRNRSQETTNTVDETMELLEDEEEEATMLHVSSTTGSTGGQTQATPIEEPSTLDEALALAQGFTDVMNGNDNSVMEMLETLSGIDGPARSP